ncbi:MAG: hypothetical protein M0016_03315 [Deltaproteobacteria bacterium]|jgi:hypothetical protein|nr:hypothetical protein [Deltaproteobacteria bacterium]MCL5879748.1 hypothetical protein [Deltaproteobacteria bacterium]MDA8304177.1 hypothetical protein [Deltaproteobacteria bacterium]
MDKIQDITIDDLDWLIEEKIIELLGDPDSGLQLKEEFKTELECRLKKPSKKISHREALKRFA